MSEFCIGIVRNPSGSDSFEQSSMLEGIRGCAENLGFEFMRGCTFEEPFLQQEVRAGDLVFELTIDGVAEKILCPDWCQYNGRFMPTCLKERLLGLQALSRHILQLHFGVDLFIGESGCERDDLIHRTVSVSEMVACLETEYERRMDVPDVHLSIRE